MMGSDSLVNMVALTCLDINGSALNSSTQIFNKTIGESETLEFIGCTGAISIQIAPIVSIGTGTKVCEVLETKISN